jgi:hypothetical protein
LVDTTVSRPFSAARIRTGRFACRFGVAPNEIFDEQGNVFRSLAERWNDNRNNIESVEKIPAEGSGSDGEC